MFVNSDYKFTLFVSQANYDSKPQNEELSKMRFAPQQLTISSALECATHGKVFCYVFSTNNRDGILSTKDKAKENFISTSTIFYDFDNMKVSMDDYIKSIPYKPSFAYPTYSNGKNGKSRFRLVYVFDTAILGEENFNSIYHAIGNANQFIREINDEQGGWDVRNVAQMYYGTTQQVSTYISNTVYSKCDFLPYIAPVTDKGASTKKSQTKEFKKYEGAIDEAFLSNLYNNTFDSFFMIYYDSFYSNYTQSLETTLTLSDNEMWYEYPEDYVAVFRKRQGKHTLKWNVGEDRKKKLFVTAQMMLYNCPDLTIENLIYNLSIERCWYYDNTDNKINNKVLIDTAINAFNKRIELSPSKHGSYRVNKDYWAAQGVGVHQAIGYIRRERNVKEILPYIESDKTIKENHQILFANGVNVSVRTLERMVARGDISVIIKKRNYNNTLLLKSRKDATILQNQIIDLMIENNKITANEIAKQLQIDITTVKRNIKKMRGILIDRDGNNRSGHWIVRDDTVS